MSGVAYEFVDGRFFTKVATLGQGRSFGHVALQRRCKRTATVKTEADCQLAYLSKDDYESSVQKIASDLEQARLDFLKGMPIFRDFARGKV